MTSKPHTFSIGAHSFAAPVLECALYLVATPIGNLSDITIRALEVLAGVDVLACEDTRVSRILLNRYAITKRPISYQEHNANEAGARLIDYLNQGKSVAIISDAGTPLISDPGYKLVRKVHALGLKIVPIPGPSASLAALTASGLATDQFLFVGFLPTRVAARKSKLEDLNHSSATLIFYESPRRLIATLKDMIAVFGGHREAAMCRELTKTFETISLNTLEALLERCEGMTSIRGEIVVVVAGACRHARSFSTNEVDKLLSNYAAKLPARKAASEVAAITNLGKNELYKRLIALKK